MGCFHITGNYSAYFSVDNEADIEDFEVANQSHIAAIDSNLEAWYMLLYSTFLSLCDSKTNIFYLGIKRRWATHVEEVST